MFTFADRITDPKHRAVIPDLLDERAFQEAPVARAPPGCTRLSEYREPYSFPSTCEGQRNEERQRRDTTGRVAAKKAADEAAVSAGAEEAKEAGQGRNEPASAANKPVGAQQGKGGPDSL